MKRQSHFWLGSGLFIGGILAGALIAGLSLAHYAKRKVIIAEAANIISTVHMLERLRADEIEKLGDFLEEKLSGHLLSFSEENLNDPKYDQIVVRAVQKAKRYRSSHPFNDQDPDVAKEVQTVIQKVGN